MNLIKEFVRLVLYLAAILGIVIFALYVASAGKAIAG